MSKHTTEENKVEDLLKTLTNSDKITVSNIEQPFVQFTAQEGIVQYLQSLIETPLDFAGKLWRAVKGVTPTNVDKSDSDVQYQPLSEDVNKGLGVITTENVDKSDSDVQYQALSEDVNKGLGVITTENVDKSGSDVQYQALSEEGNKDLEVITTSSPNKLLHNIITPECIERLGLQPFEETDYRIVSSTTQSKSKTVAERIESGAKLIGFALNHPEYIKKILDRKVGLITQEEDFDLLEDTDLLPDQNVFCVARVDKTVTAKFNTARFMQVMQEKGYLSLSESSPIIAKLMSSGNTYSVNLEHLQFYIGSKIAPMIFQPTRDDNKLMLKPIGLYNAVSDSQETDKALVGTKSLFNIAVDVSGSMESELTLCKEKLRIILKKIVDTTEDWTIIITKFNSTYSSEVFESTNNKVEDLVRLGSYIKAFTAGGNTNLLGTMYDQFSGLGSIKLGEVNTLATL